MSLDSMKEIFDRMEAEHKPFWEIVLETDMDERQVTRQQSMAKMLTTWQYMVDAADTYTGRRRSVSGLVGGDGLKMRQYSIRGRAMSGGYVSEVIAEALSMAESNACMRRIVAAPTAGACGVLPAVLLPMCKYEELSQHRILEALYVASGIGAVIAYKACIAGASGGCQAEIGTASAMAAGALVALRDGTGQQIGHAVAMALKNLMGLVCDPVAGLVEVPCVKRNVIGAVNAISAADMALAGIESRIPVAFTAPMTLRGGHGPGRHRKPHPRGRGHRRHGRGGPPHAGGVPGNRPGRPGRHPHRPPGQAADAPGVPGILIPVRSIFLKNNNPYTKDIPDAWHRGCLSLSKKPHRVCRPQAANQLRSFSSGACTWTKILLRSRPGRRRPCR